MQVLILEGIDQLFQLKEGPKPVLKSGEALVNIKAFIFADDNTAKCLSTKIRDSCASGIIVNLSTYFRTIYNSPNKLTN